MSYMYERLTKYKVVGKFSELNREEVLGIGTIFMVILSCALDIFMTAC